ncbi:VOC family protein [Rhodococcus sp. G-MC3]|uniref:VOC family protein n=1 Tax=Rhodococcus sp. G-MC3 TaxID=3046209 RepID=UPI0024BACECA|nr:VOC family protein [Rhodococcus sp. G-MC3]MDJ0394831.1 VOC family protein [Rhodococcus sp. G-MC3]
MLIALCSSFIRGIITSAGGVGAASSNPTPSNPTSSNPTSMAVSSMLMRVLRLEPSIDFYCDVFGCTVALREADAALLLAPDGFQIYLYANGPSLQRPIEGLGVKEVMWSAATETALEQVGDRLRQRYPSTYVHSAGGVNFVDGRDPDGNRVLVAYPSPLQLPRHIIADRFK